MTTKMQKLTVAMGVLLLGSIAHAGEVTPGMWATTTSYSMNGSPMRPIQQQGCLSAQDAANYEKNLLQQAAAGGCTPITFEMSNGKVVGEFNCVSPTSRGVVTANGRYSTMDYDVDVRSKGTSQATPYDVTGKWTGKRLGDC